jgi:hypothetical protein
MASGFGAESWGIGPFIFVRNDLLFSCGIARHDYRTFIKPCCPIYGSETAVDIPSILERFTLFAPVFLVRTPGASRSATAAPSQVRGHVLLDGIVT